MDSIAEQIITTQDLDSDLKKVESNPLEIKIENSKLNPEDEIVEEKPILWINDVGYGTKGNISIFIGKAKSKKSMLVSLFSSVLLGSKNIEGFHPALVNAKGIIFDTEQSKRHCQLQYRRIERLYDNDIKDCLAYYMLRPYSPLERLKMIEKVIYSRDDIDFVVIDGIADLLAKGVNDEEEAIAITNLLMKWSLERNIHIITILHQNKGDNNAKGHIGSQLVQKSETVLSVEKEQNQKEISTVSSPYSRGMEIEPFHFSVDESGVPFIVDDFQENKNQSKSNSKDPQDYECEVNFNVVKDVFQKEKELSYGALNDKIRYVLGRFSIKVGERKTRDWITYFKEEEMIKQDGNNKPYMLNTAWRGNVVRHP